MFDYYVVFVIDIGIINCKVSCYFCYDVLVLEVCKFLMLIILLDKGEVDFDIEVLWQVL